MSIVASIMQANLLSFDVEFWYEGYKYRGILPENSNLDTQRDCHTFTRVLDLLDKYDAKSTCYVLGRFAAENPDLIKEISSRGHEVATHGYDHQPITRLVTAGDHSAFLKDLSSSQKLLQDLTGQPINGHRATSWSLRSGDVNWFLELLSEQGFSYDSSMFPATFHPYGDAGMPSSPTRYRFGENTIVEIPAQTWSVLGLRLSVLGGFYIRALPLLFNKLLCKVLKEPQRIYFHPYDFDSDCPKLPGPFLFKLMRYYGLSRPYQFLDWYLQNYKVQTFGQFVSSEGSTLHELSLK